MVEPQPSPHGAPASTPAPKPVDAALLGDPSPFSPGFGGWPPCFAGRAWQTKQVGKALKALFKGKPPRHLVIYGPRGMGKSVLLKWMKDQCERYPQEVDIVSTTPEKRLTSASDLPRLLLPDPWLTRARDKIGIFLKDAKASAGGESTGAGVTLQPITDEQRVEALTRTAIEACKERTRVLILDEAHATDHPEVLRMLLTTVQEVSQEAPLMLAMAGTPGLVPYLRSAEVKSTFFERATKIGVGRIAPDEARKAIRQPLDENGISIDDAHLERIAGDAQCYPYFLQLWGDALWDALDGARRPATITQEHMDEAARDFAESREDFYLDRYTDMLNDMRFPRHDMLESALAVRRAFTEKRQPGLWDIQSAIEAALQPRYPDPGQREAYAKSVRMELNRTGYFWSPPRGAPPEPGIPSFMDFIAQMHEQGRDDIG